VIATGAVSTLAGSLSGAAGSADGTGTLATFNNPYGITTDGTNIYVADTMNNSIRKIVIATGVVTTLAGPGAVGNGALATFNNPFGITTDRTNIYVADTVNNMIRQIVIATGAVTTLAGSVTSGAADGTGTSASFNNPYGITTDGINLYVADTYNHKIRKIVISSGVVTTVAGTGTFGSVNNNSGSLAKFDYPRGITTDGTNLYVADTTSQLIRKIVLATTAVSTLAGSGVSGFADSTTASLALFNSPSGITTDGVSLYVADTSNKRIRRIY